MNNFFMEKAIEIAKKSKDDLPVGCVIEKDGKIISSARNEKEKRGDLTLHSEIVAIRRASSKLKNWRLTGCNLYVTLEPCPMCAWAILNSGIENVYFGAYDLNYGALGSKINLLNISPKKPKVYGGIMEKETKELLDDYFKKLRAKSR